MTKRRWQRPPRLRWFLAAWGLFVLACFLPAMTYDLRFSDASPTSSPDPGVSCLLWSYVFFVGGISYPASTGAESLYLGSMALPNTFMLLSPILAFRLPRRAFGPFAWIGAAMAVHVLSWFAFASLSRDYGPRVGAVVWAASFACLAAAWSVVPQAEVRGGPVTSPKGALQ